MNNEGIGGRFLPHQIGSRYFDRDVYRGQRRRPWMCFRVGASTPEITKACFLEFIDRVRRTLREKGLLLDEETEPLKYTIVEEDYQLFQTELQEGLAMVPEKYQPGVLSRPIVITFIDQVREARDQVDEIINSFSDHMYFFKLHPKDLLDQLNSDEYDQLAADCEDFFKFVSGIERIPQSLAIQIPIEEKPLKFEGTDIPFVLPKRRNEGARNQMVSGMIDRKSRQEQENAPPGLPPPGLGNRSSDRNFISPPPGLNHPPRSERSSENQPSTSDSLSAPPGILLPRPPGISAPQRTNRSSNAHNNSSGSLVSITDVPIIEREYESASILSVTDLEAARIKVEQDDNERGMPIKKNSSTMSKYIYGKKLLARFEKPFVNIGSNIDLLCVVNYAVSSCNKEVHPDSKAILRGAFVNGFPMKLKTKFLDHPMNTGDWSSATVEMFFEIIQLYFYTTRFKGGFMLTIDSFVTAWEELSVSYSVASKEKLREARVTARELENARKLMNQVDKWIYQAEGDAANRTIRSHDETEDREMTFRNDSQRHREDHQNRREELNYRRQEEREVYRVPPQNHLPAYDQTNRHDIIRHEDRERDEVDHFQPRDDSSLGFRRDGGAVNRNADISSSSGSTLVSESFRKESAKQLESSNEEQIPKEIVNTDERPKMQYKYTEQNYEPPWMKSERTDPPEDFRTLTSVPVLADYVNPEEPYLRRIQEDGIYKSAAHYLDVQFRLLREDLVSPLRDGIDIYRKNGTCKGHRIDGNQNSDIVLINVEKVDGKQVEERDGQEMRVVWPAKYDLNRLLDNDRDMKELGLMMLSDDGFYQDFHLTIVQNSLLGIKGCLHLIILEETSPFKPNKTYQMAQGSSYLPSYRHVLENIKNINPFKPIPFERYLVHGKKEIFRPLFHRHTKCDEQIAEERRLEKIYGEIRSIAVSNRFMKNKPVPSGVDEDDDDDGYYKKKSSKKNEDETDLEYDQLSEPMFRKEIGPENNGSDQILIDKKWYRISRLLDDYHPKNLDDSQRRAFCHSFRNELSLIQGPPGTGKTHIGVQIVKTMLQNRSHWRITSPILIVCYTNAGLDNLLERVWQMIDDDEELSKDNGKPRMIRFGRNCESEFLKRSGVMRQDVQAQFRSQVPEKVLREQSTAGNQKRKKAESLVVSSFTLYCSRNKLLSYEVLHRVMPVSQQNEIIQFAAEHVDSKDRLLSYDEALACWLLDRDFGRAKSSAKTTNKQKSKFRGMSEDSDDEKLKSVPVVDSDSEDDSDLDEEQILDKLFNKMNVSCTGKDALDSLSSDADEYYSKGRWEIVRDQTPAKVILMGIKNKGGLPTDDHIESLVKEVEEMILSAPTLKKEEVEDVKYIFSLARPKRWALYITWCQQVRSAITQCLPVQIREYRRACQHMQKAMNLVDAEIMRMPMIIAATTSGCSRLRPIMEMVQPRILIVEEAAEVLEAHIISAMISSIEHTVMIGDHKQLRPNPAVHELGTEYGMRISMFERLAERGLPFCQLREQHRMNTTIADLVVRTAFYDNVHDAENVQHYPNVEGVAANLFFWSHSQKEETPDGVSWLNKHEADMTAGLVNYLLKQNYTSSDIVVLATYSAQRSFMYREYSSVFGTMDCPIVRVETVDSYQGKESKIAIVSLVRSHRGINEYTGIGFLAVANRICVALTRAQHGMYIIGNGAYLMNQSELWKKIGRSLDKHNLIEYNLPLKCTTHGRITLIGNPRDFSSKSPEGGCTEVCNIEKECGHVCQRLCHPKLEDHKLPCDYKCNEKCSNPEYQHECPKRCYEECGNCMILVEVTLACGHRTTTPCSRAATTLCDQMCKKTIDCGHVCQNYCGLPCSGRMSCKQTVELQLECGHVKKLKCFETIAETLDLECVERCSERMLSCDHQCAEICGKKCTVECPAIVNVSLKCGHKQNVVCSMIAPDKSVDHIPCETTVPTSLNPCGHIGHITCGTTPSSDLCLERCKTIIQKCEHTCGDDCGTCFKTGEHICQQRCAQVLSCGHTCSSKCGVKCPPCQTFCANSCEHQSCGAGEKAFGRKCHQICVLCTRNCGNKCEHQSCQKRCFEECDIRPCASLCQKTLKCGHACLGMCGEMCPNICGTCERSKYSECVADLPKVNKIRPLIMIPKCYHVFAVETLDAHVAIQSESNSQLTCPKCRAVILRVCRYARYTKKRVLQLNIKKLQNTPESLSTLLTNANLFLSKTFDILNQLCKNQEPGVAKMLVDFRTQLYELHKKSPQIPATEKYRAHFCQEIFKAALVIAKLMGSACRHRMISRKNVPPTFEVMVLTLIADNPFLKMIKELTAISEELATALKYDMIGATLPKLRFHIAKMSILNQLILMAQALKSEHLDLREADSRNIMTACANFFDRDERQQLDVNIKPIEELMLRTAPSMTKMMIGFRWENLGVPDF